MIQCKFCGMERQKNIYQHEKMCPKNPERVMPSLKDKTKIETKKKEQPENNTKIIQKQDEGGLAFDAPAKTAIISDDKTAGEKKVTIPPKEAGTGLPASSAESKEEQTEEPQKKSWLVEICIAIIIIVFAAIAFFVYFAIPEKEEKI